MTERIYEITTYDEDTGWFTPQIGIKRFCRGLGELRKELRKLRRMGYDGSRSDTSLMIARIHPQEAT